MNKIKYVLLIVCAAVLSMSCVKEEMDKVEPTDPTVNLPPLEPDGWEENDSDETPGESPVDTPGDWVDNPSGGDLGNQEDPAWNDTNNGHVVG